MASIQYAATKYRHAAGLKVTYDAWHYIDLVEGHQLQLSNQDNTRTFVAIYLHENRLYIVEATVPQGYPPPGLFQQNLSFLDEKGGRVRYNEITPTVFRLCRRGVVGPDAEAVAEVGGASEAPVVAPRPPTRVPPRHHERGVASLNVEQVDRPSVAFGGMTPPVDP